MPRQAVNQADTMSYPEACTVYNTGILLKIRNWKLRVFYIIFIIAIGFGYTLGYVILYQKGQQAVDDVESSVTTTVKGILFSNFSNASGIGMRTWDSADTVIPAKDNNAFFVLTNVIVTPKQTQSYCGEDPSVKGSICTDDLYCEYIKGTILYGGNGPITGRCVESKLSENKTVCQIYGWCPLEKRGLKMVTPVLSDTRNFTVFIKNYIEFPKFDVSRRNLLHFEDDAYLESCLYNSKSSRDKFCPIFRLDTIVEEAGANYEEMAMEGGVIRITIDWQCDLDWGKTIDDCEPKYSFRKLNRGDFNKSKGFNFRYADHFMEGNIAHRTLYKAYGIRFLVNVQGTARQFDFMLFMTQVAHFISYTTIATILCDAIVTYCLPSGPQKYIDEQETRDRKKCWQICWSRTCSSVCTTIQEYCPCTCVCIENCTTQKEDQDNPQVRQEERRAPGQVNGQEVPDTMFL